ncbi:DUF397 domain-containing protein [Streptomyces sp. V2]|uniref:DUF397 domain-containing protein n=1 Tax=Streptomyces sp. V2 TaxID=1424099 RepID=UPI000D6699FD|nr:DUF397 domain-containing protein [Streptomyces sp. V2]PWG12575.1 DUF397 domain-containing protein [Streptomyces sp. V2]
MSTTDLAWFKSSYSGTQGDSCVEVAFWFKSSYSGTDGDDCVEVSVAQQAICVRDSKDVTRPHFSVGRDGWTHFVGYVSEA